MSFNLRGARVVVDCSGDSAAVRSRTHQSFSKDADINVIMGKYRKTGVLVDPTLVSSSRRPQFGDFSDLPDYSVMMSRMVRAQQDFLSLPAELRARFSNDVGQCLDFLADPKNVEEAVKLSLLPESTPAYVSLLKERADAEAKALAEAEAAKATPQQGE